MAVRIIFIAKLKSPGNVVFRNHEVNIDMQVVYFWLKTYPNHKIYNNLLNVKMEVGLSFMFFDSKTTILLKSHNIL